MDLAQLTRELRALRDEAVEAARSAGGSDQLAERELEFLGKKGRLTVVLRGIGALPPEDRPKVGAIANEVQTEIREAFTAAADATRTTELAARLAAEATDASHASEFFQVEGLMVDEGTTLADLKGLLDQFAQAMYGEGKRTRFRPGYYPFTEPSVAFDVECLV
ncbi:MAG: hypothetical protein ACJ77E_05790, partial [Gaiellaceae bacterium]